MFPFSSWRNVFVKGLIFRLSLIYEKYNYDTMILQFSMLPEGKSKTTQGYVSIIFWCLISPLDDIYDISRGHSAVFDNESCRILENMNNYCLSITLKVCNWSLQSIFESFEHDVKLKTKQLIDCSILNIVLSMYVL